MRAFVVVNPHSANGSTAREWPGIERALRDTYAELKIVHTRKRGQATGLVRNALQEGHGGRHGMSARNTAVPRNGNRLCE